MYVHEEIRPSQRYDREIHPCGELSRPGRCDSTYVGDEILGFLSSQRPISAAEYACWHSLVRHQLIPSNPSSDGSAVRQIDFQLAKVCFDEIENAHSHLDSITK